MREREAVPRSSSGFATTGERSRRKAGRNPRASDGAEQAAGRHDWLRWCEGFRVDSPDGRIGFVEDVLLDLDSGRAEALVVRAGLSGRRLLLVSTANVEEVVPRRKRIVLRGSPRLVGGDSRRDEAS